MKVAEPSPIVEAGRLYQTLLVTEVGQRVYGRLSAVDTLRTLVDRRLADLRLTLDYDQVPGTGWAYFWVVERNGPNDRWAAWRSA